MNSDDDDSSDYPTARLVYVSSAGSGPGTRPPSVDGDHRSSHNNTNSGWNTRGNNTARTTATSNGAGTGNSVGDSDFLSAVSADNTSVASAVSPLNSTARPLSGSGSLTHTSRPHYQSVQHSNPANTSSSLNNSVNSLGSTQRYLLRPPPRNQRSTFSMAGSRGHPLSATDTTTNSTPPPPPPPPPPRRHSPAGSSSSLPPSPPAAKPPTTVRVPSQDSLGNSFPPSAYASPPLDGTQSFSSPLPPPIAPAGAAAAAAVAGSSSSLSLPQTPRAQGTSSDSLRLSNSNSNSQSRSHLRQRSDLSEANAPTTTSPRRRPVSPAFAAPFAPPASRARPGGKVTTRVSVTPPLRASSSSAMVTPESEVHEGTPLSYPPPPPPPPPPPSHPSRLATRRSSTRPPSHAPDRGEGGASQASNSTSTNGAESREPFADGGAAGGGGGWWAAARRAAATQAAWVGYYLDSVVDPAAARRPDSEGVPPSTNPHQQQQQQPEGTRGATTTTATTGTRNNQGADPLMQDEFSGLFTTPPPTPAADAARGYNNNNNYGSGGPSAEVQQLTMPPPPRDGSGWRRPTLPIIQYVAANREAELLDEASDATDDDGGDSLSFEIDLIGALRGYRSSPTDVFGHLVAAALNVRSRDAYPVTGAELAEAARNPHLVRMVVMSEKLDTADPLAQAEVQATVDALVRVDAEGGLSPVVYDYLAPLLFVESVRLSHAQYKLLKRAGFEYISVLHACPHVLPPERAHQVTLLHGHAAALLNAILLLIQLLVNTFATVSIIIAMVIWFTNNSVSRSNGYYTLIVYGCSWVLNLILMIFLARTKPDEMVYEPRNHISFPSTFTLVVPALPTFDVLCLVSYVRAWRSGLLVLRHNIVATSCLWSASFAVLYGYPQWIAQSFLNRVLNNASSDGGDARTHGSWSFTLLEAAIIIQWFVALLRITSLHLFGECMNVVGFARFAIRHTYTTLRGHRGVPTVLSYVEIFVFWSSVYLIIACAYVEAEPGDRCGMQKRVAIAMPSASCFYQIVMTVVGLCLSGCTDAVSLLHTTVRTVPVMAMQIIIFVVLTSDFGQRCRPYHRRIMHNAFIFGYLAWVVYAVAFIVWAVSVVLWALRDGCDANLFPRLAAPLARPRTALPGVADAAKHSANGDSVLGGGDAGNNNGGEGEGAAASTGNVAATDGRRTLAAASGVEGTSSGPSEL